MDALISNPVLNSPFEEPARHFRFTDDGITNEVVPARRLSGYFVPIPQPKKKGKQLDFGTEWTQDRFQESEFINRVRARVGAWRQAGYPNVTRVTRNLLDHWNDPTRERRLFFCCQLEAVETAIYLVEAAPRTGDAWIENDLRRANESANPGLPRMAFKMAAGSGKTVVMGMLIAWQALNNLLSPGSRKQLQARAKLRALAIVEASLSGEKAQATDLDLSVLIKRIRKGVTWQQLFPGVSSPEIDTQGNALSISIRLTKKEGDAVQLVPERTPGATVVAVKRVNELEYYSLGLKDLASKMQLSQPRTLALIRHLRLQGSPEYHRDITVGTTTFRRYSAKALEALKKGITSVNMEDVWRERGSHRR